MTALEPCPDRPSCVSSQAQPGRHAIAPFRLASAERWADLVAQVAAKAHDSQIEAEAAHFVFQTRLLRFKDDVHLVRDGELVHIRSCSRVGHWDLGANRRRMEGLRRELIASGILAS